jgi:hypothetical protein
MEVPLRRSVSSVAEKIQEILDAAERVARDIEAEAEVEAARYRKDRVREADALITERADRLKGLSTSLSEHADRVRTEVIALSSELSRAADELRGHRYEAKPAAAEPGSDGEVPAPVAYPGTGRPLGADDGEAAVPEEALLRATQMSVAGNSREEIESALRDEFELDDPSAVTNHVLGHAKAS